MSVAGGRGERIDSIGIDTWGVDFACVDPDGDLLGLPRAYRDPYTDGVPEEFSVRCLAKASMRRRQFR